MWNVVRINIIILYILFHTDVVLFAIYSGGRARGLFERVEVSPLCCTCRLEPIFMPMPSVVHLMEWMYPI